MIINIEIITFVDFERKKYFYHCHVTGKYMGPAHQKNINIVTRKQNTFKASALHNHNNYDCHLFV